MPTCCMREESMCEESNWWGRRPCQAAAATGMVCLDAGGVIHSVERLECLG